MEMNKIESIKVKVIPDYAADTSWIGEYTDNLEPGVIIRDYNEFYEKIPTEMERDADGKFIGKAEPNPPQKGRTFRGFLPYAGGEKQGTKDYYKYGMQDYKRMEELNNGDWQFIGIRAEAEVSYKTINGSRLEHLTSGGLWGIESDAGDYLNEIMKEELSDLKNHLQNFNVDTSTWDELTKDIELEY
jgi:hypothetical protein